MVAYTSRARVEKLLPKGVSFTDTDYDGWIADASEEVDEEVGAEYPVISDGAKFAAYPDTPRTIRQIATWLAVGAAYDELKEISRGPEPPKSDRYRRRALDRLGRIRDGKSPIESGEGQRLNTNDLPIVVVSPDPTFQDIALSPFPPMW